MNTAKLTMWARNAGAACLARRGGFCCADRRGTRSSIRRGTITVIIPFAGGSASDVVSRIMLDKMSKSMGQAIIVENRPGAGGNSGTLQGVRAAPDGYTLIGGGSGPVAANLSLYKSLGYDPEKDLEMISPFAGFTIVVVVSKTLHDQFAQGADRARQGEARPQLRLGRHRQLAAPVRRVFRPGDRREDDARALSQHRPVRPGPDRRHRAARLPVVSEHRRPDRQAKGAIPSPLPGINAFLPCPTRRPQPKRACRNTRSTAGLRCSLPPARRSRSSSSSTRS